MDFKKGDRVKVIHSLGDILTAGSEWNVVGTYNNGGNFLQLRSDDGKYTDGWCMWRFKLVIQHTRKRKSLIK